MSRYNILVCLRGTVSRNSSFPKDYLFSGLYRWCAGNYRLARNCPNPFNPTTTIEYGLPSSGTVSLKVCNLLGQEVATLANGNQNAGTYHVVRDGPNAFGTPLTRGVYFYRLEAKSSSGAYANLKKMLLLK